MPSDVIRNNLNECMKKYYEYSESFLCPVNYAWKDWCMKEEIVARLDAIVEVDESKFGKLKYVRGRPVKGKWVFRGNERNSNKCVFRVVPCRTKECLLAVIKEWVLPGTTIISDFWASYSCLENEGFQHLKINHSLTFVCPVTDAHTKSIEGLLSGTKRFLGNTTNRTEEMFDSYLHEFMWQRKRSLQTLLSGCG
ncbi:putative transposase-like protein [Trichonephila clavipes]|nr:putative transposase-like protein [Trichonephila clavipes]